ncbi:MAG: DUF1622 domain-containing protein [Hyphomicrobium zavarzinii]|jgi:uncharacterized membrane protein|uniref:DUF1622 domain-containing protein n=1 Tax=Hyphomicrobium TaxID=81 RepID=UPI000380156C|nr:MULTISPECIES: DUF1622 domain-containing protein [Hyphomicrobium]MBL8846190.1 DUF1622 domain-containing protein [Hyphomicrobium zavarzinii]WBT38468.1 DUF1622 domain-containing protein [Hyphomicrobium sp. DMF-1]
MEETFALLTRSAIVAIDAMAFLVIVFGSVEAFVAVLKTLLVSVPDAAERRDIWLRYGRWLVAGLTFQLAADIIETAITTEWDQVARLAAIAVVRTFLNYFLERDIADVRERQREAANRNEVSNAGRPATMMGD